MVLITSGDSWTQGDSPANTPNWEAKKNLDWYDIPLDFGDPYWGQNLAERISYKFYDSDVWPKVLGRLLGTKTINIGRLGVGNKEICMSTISTVQRLLDDGEKDIFVIVGWSSMLRLLVYAQDIKTRKIVPIQLRPWDQEFSAYFKESRIVEDNFVLEIHRLQEYLKSKNVKFLFFNAFDVFDNFDNNYFKDLIDLNYWINRDIKTPIFRDYIADIGGLPENNKMQQGEWFQSGHPTDKAHIEWAKFLKEYIEKNKLI